MKQTVAGMQKAMSWDPGSDRLFPRGVGTAAIVLGTVWLERVIERAPIARPQRLLFRAAPPVHAHAANTASK